MTISAYGRESERVKAIFDIPLSDGNYYRVVMTGHGPGEGGNLWYALRYYSALGRALGLGDEPSGFARNVFVARGEKHLIGNSGVVATGS